MLLGIIIGIVIGGFAGFLCAALCASAARQDACAQCELYHAEANDKE